MLGFARKKNHRVGLLAKTEVKVAFDMKIEWH